MIPKREVITEAVYDVLSKNSEMRLKTIYDETAESLKLTSSDLAILDNSGEIFFYHEVRWSLQTLKAEGRVDNVGYGIWAAI